MSNETIIVYGGFIFREEIRRLLLELLLNENS